MSDADVSEETRKTNYYILWNNYVFGSCLTCLLEIVKTAAELGNLQSVVDACDTLISGFDMQSSDDLIDKSEYMKRMYKKLRDVAHLSIANELKPDPRMFKLTDHKSGKQITLVPGVDIGAVLEFMPSENIGEMWGQMWQTYIAAANVLSALGNVMNESDAAQFVQIKQFVNHMKLKHRPYNMWHGDGEQDGEADMSAFEYVPEGWSGDMMSILNGMNVDELNRLTVAELVGKLNMTGLTGGVDLMDTINKITPEELAQIPGKIIDIIAGDDTDPEMRQVYEDITGNVVQGIKENKPIGEIVKELERNKGKFNPNALQKTQANLQKFMSTDGNMFENLKDEQGNPINPAAAQDLKKMMSTAAKNGKLNPMQLMQMLQNAGVQPPQQKTKKSSKSSRTHS